MQVSFHFLVSTFNKERYPTFRVFANMSSPSLYLELAALGVASQSFVAQTLDGNSITYWRFTTVKHTPFAIEPVNVRATGVAQFGSKATFTIPRQGDLVWSTFVHMQLPNIVSGTAASVAAPAVNDQAAMWKNSVGHVLLQKVEFVVGGQIIDTWTAQALSFYEELSGQPGKRLGEAIGRYPANDETARKLAANEGLELYVPLYFTFCQHTGLAFPLVATHFHTVEIRIEFASANQCLDQNTAKTAVGTYTGAAQPALTTAAPTAIAAGDLQADLECFMVYLDSDERAKFAMGSFEQVVTQCQYNEFTLNSTGAVAALAGAATPTSNHNHEVQINNIVKEYIFGVRPREFHDDGEGTDDREGTDIDAENLDFRGIVSAVGSTAGMAYGDIGDDLGLEQDTVANFTLKFNNQDRVTQRPGKFFRLVTPYVFHTNIPDRFLYVWSFAVAPEDPNPSNGANHSRIDNVSFNYELNRHVFGGAAASGTATACVAAFNLNILKFAFGLCAQRYAM